MNEIQWLKSLKSPNPVVPAVDVSRDVMAAVARAPAPTTDRAAIWVWSIAAFLGLTTSTAVGAFAFMLWQAANDPVHDMASAWSTVLQ